jgi:hypothetical protein
MGILSSCEFRPAHRDAIINLSSCECDRRIGMLSSCENYRIIGMLSSLIHQPIILWVRPSRTPSIDQNCAISWPPKGAWFWAHNKMSDIISRCLPCGKQHFIPPKRRFWNDKQKMKCKFSKHFSSARVLDLGHEPLKSLSKIRISSFVHRSKIFVWGAYICENYPRRIGQGLNDASCMLGGMLSSLVGLPNPAWEILANVVSHMGPCLSKS